MRLVRQPKRSKLCAQACVATLMGTSLQEAVRLCGSGTLVEKQMRAALRGFRGTVFGITHPNFRHWLLYKKGWFFSPAVGEFRDPPPWILESVVTSRLEL